MRIAMLKYVKRDARGNANGDCSDAVERLCQNVLMKHLSADALQNSNAFRKRHCYLEKVDNCLRRHLQSLRSLYARYSASNSAVAGFTLADDELMSVGEWMDFVKHMGLVESKQLTMLDAKAVFVWSRIRTCADQSDRSVIRLRHLTFEDFMVGGSLHPGLLAGSENGSERALPTLPTHVTPSAPPPEPCTHGTIAASLDSHCWPAGGHRAPIHHVRAAD